MAEQYKETRRLLKRTKNGELVIVDPARTYQRMFLLYYWVDQIGSLSGILTVILEFSVGFWAAFLLPLGPFIIGIVVLLLGRKRYIRSEERRVGKECRS